MSPRIAVRPPAARQVTRVLSDGSGRPEDEVVLLAAAVATAAASVVAWRGLAWAVLTVTDVDLRPTLPGRGRG